KAVLSGNPRVATDPSFPEVHASGFVMQLRDSGDMVHVRVQAKGMRQQYVYLFVHARQIISHAERQMLCDNRAEFVVQRKEFQEGISHLTLDTEELHPVCERLFFTHPAKKLPIGISGNQKVFAPRKRVSIALQSTADSDFSI